jgi:hypothetical protein
VADVVRLSYGKAYRTRDGRTVHIRPGAKYRQVWAGYGSYIAISVVPAPGHEAESVLDSWEEFGSDIRELYAKFTEAGDPPA